MANHVSAEKRARQRVKRTDRNRALRTSVRSAVKRARAALDAGNAAAAAAPVKEAAIALAKAVSKGILRKETASRATSRIQAALHKISG